VADAPPAARRQQTGSLVAIGAAAGLLSGILGVGGGILMVPALVVLIGFGQHRAHATSLAAIIPIAAVGAFVFGRADNVDLLAGVVLAAGSLLGVQVGAHLMNRLSDARLAVAFGLFLVGLALAMFFL
jgi:uncharacterized membrane protein YfcA